MRIRPDQLDDLFKCGHCKKSKPGAEMKKYNLPDGKIYIYPMCYICSRKRYKLGELRGKAEKITTKQDKKNLAKSISYTKEYHCHGCGVVYTEICQCRKCGTYLTEKDGYTREKLLV